LNKLKPLRKNILIIGGVAAGTSAAAKAKRMNPNLDITIFEQDEHISYGACSLPYYIGGVIPDYHQLIHYTPETFEKEKCCIVKIRHRVEEIKPHRRRISVQNLQSGGRQEYAYDKLLIATGAKAVWPDPDWKKFNNVFSIKDLHDGLRLNQFIANHHPRTAVILGGGYIGMEMAEALTLRKIQTIILEQQTLPMSGFETESREWILKELRKQNVDFYGSDTILDLKKDGQNVIEVVTKNHSLKADLLLVALGFKPENHLASEAHIRCGKYGGIVTDSYLKTNADHIYSAGACTEIKNKITSKPIYLPLGNIANKMGRIAGINLAGGHTEFPPVIPTMAVKIFNLEAARVGLSSHEAEQHGYSVNVDSVTGQSKAKMFPGTKPVFVTIIYDKRTRLLLGGNVIGEEGAALRADTLSVAIDNKLTVEQLARLNLIYTPPFAPVWDPILLAAGKAGKDL
jgi:CoA-dependent NAD(P)H sulfur oxidoreductase